MLFDSVFLIHAAGHRGKRDRSAAERFLEANQDVPLYTSRICWAEFAEGSATATDVESALHRFTVIEIDERIAWGASRISRELRRSGLHIGDNDIWIAASAIAFGLPLVTRNSRHFGRVKGLAVASY